MMSITRLILHGRLLVTRGTLDAPRHSDVHGAIGGTASKTTWSDGSSKFPVGALRAAARKLSPIKQCCGETSGSVARPHMEAAHYTPQAPIRALAHMRTSAMSYCGPIG